MWIKFHQYMRQRTLNKVRDINRINVFVINQVEEVADFVARCVDNAQAISGIVVGIETSYQNAEHHTYGNQQGNEARRRL